VVFHTTAPEHSGLEDQ